MTLDIMTLRITSAFMISVVLKSVNMIIVIMLSVIL